MEPRKRFQFKSYVHGKDVKIDVFEISKNCVIRKNNQDIIMGLRYSFYQDYSNKDIKVALSNVSETF